MNETRLHIIAPIHHPSIYIYDIYKLIIVDIFDNNDTAVFKRKELESIFAGRIDELLAWMSERKIVFEDIEGDYVGFKLWKSLIELRTI